MKTIIVSAFPACGKSYVFQNQDKLLTNFSCLDSDSSEFSWVKDSEGNNTKERNPDFPNNYIQHIKDNIGKVDIIFVSSHSEVVNALEDNELRWVKVVPSGECKAEWIGRFWLRGNDNGFIEFISSNWDSFTDTLQEDLKREYLENVVTLRGSTYLSYYLGSILTTSGNYEGE